MFGTGTWSFWRNGQADGGRLAGRRKGPIGQTPRPRRGIAARSHKLAFDRLEPRELMAVDLTQEINTLLSQGVVSGTITAPDVITIGNDLTINQAQLTFTNVAPQGQGWSGNVEVQASSASLFDGSFSQTPPFSATASSIDGNYNLSTQALSISANDVTIGFGKLLTVDATDPTLAYTTGTSSSLDISAASVKLTSTTFPNLTGTASNLDITPQHVTFDNVSVTDSATETLAGILSITDPNWTVSSFDYEFGPNTIEGAITVTAASASLFKSSGSSNQESPFTATVNQLSGTYNFTNQSLNLEAQNLTLGFGQFLTATASNPAFTYDPGGTTPFEIMPPR